MIYTKTSIMLKALMTGVFMNKVKVLKLQAYKSKIEDMIAGAPDAPKHKHNQKEYLAFLTKELTVVVNHLQAIKLEFEGKS